MALSTVQQMLVLANIADLDFGPINGTVCDNATKLLPKIQLALDGFNLLSGTDYQVVWGPAVFSFNFGGLLPTFSDNNLFVVQSKSNPTQYVVATAGTDMVSIADWALEDFWVTVTIPWQYGMAMNDPRISIASFLGLTICQNLVPCMGLPGEGLTLKAFLKAQVAASGSPITITTTGHSLGGSLSPLMGLWLRDTQGTENVPEREQWDPDWKATLIVYSFAGATSGDANWADHFDSQFDTAHAFRVWNYLDVVTHAFNVVQIAQTPTLYSTTPNPTIVKIAKSAIASVKGLDYRHWQPDTPPIQAKVVPFLKEYFLQAAYQHIVAYFTGLGMPMPKKLAAKAGLSDRQL